MDSYLGYNLEMYNDLKKFLVLDVKENYIEKKRLHIILTGSGPDIISELLHELFKNKSSNPGLDNSYVGSQRFEDWSDIEKNKFKTPLLSLLSFAEIPFHVLDAHFGSDGLMPDENYGQALSNVLDREIEFVVPRSRIDIYDANGAPKETLNGTIIRPVFYPEI